MGVNRFEDLRVWQAAKKQADFVGRLRLRPEFVRDVALSDQMNRAALSVMFNIAEGFLRRLDKETGQFLRYAFASNGELKAGYYAAAGRGHMTGIELEDCVQANEAIAKMLRRWQATLATAGTRTKDQGRTKDEGRTKDQEPRTKD